MAQEAQPVERHEDRRSLVEGDADDEREVAGEVPRREGGHEAGGDGQVLAGGPAGAAGECHECGKGLQVVDDDIGDSDRLVGTAAHGNADVGGSERRGVVDAITDDHDSPPGGPQFMDGRELALGQQAGAHVGEGEAPGEPVGGGGASPVSITGLADLVGAAPTTVSQHLAKLCLAGLVRRRRSGTFVYYTAADTHVRNVLAEALHHAGHALDRHEAVDRRAVPAKG